MLKGAFILRYFPVTTKPIVPTTAIKKPIAAEVPIATLIGYPNILRIGVFITPPPIPIGAEKKPADEPRIILANKLISLGFTSLFSLEIKKLKERIRVTIEKKKKKK